MMELPAHHEFLLTRRRRRCRQKRRTRIAFANCKGSFALNGDGRQQRRRRRRRRARKPSFLRPSASQKDKRRQGRRAHRHTHRHTGQAWWARLLDKRMARRTDRRSHSIAYIRTRKSTHAVDRRDAPLALGSGGRAHSVRAAQDTVC